MGFSPHPLLEAFLTAHTRGVCPARSPRSLAPQATPPRSPSFPRCRGHCVCFSPPPTWSVLPRPCRLLAPWGRDGDRGQAGAPVRTVTPGGPGRAASSAADFQPPLWLTSPLHRVLLSGSHRAATFLARGPLLREALGPLWSGRDWGPRTRRRGTAVTNGARCPGRRWSWGAELWGREPGLRCCPSTSGGGARTRPSGRVCATSCTARAREAQRERDETQAPPRGRPGPAGT